MPDPPAISVGDPKSRLEIADDLLAARLAQAAGDLLLGVRATGLFAGRKLGAAGDAVSQEFLAVALAAHRPQDAVLSEEAIDDPARLGAARVWVIDPLDGTREYGEGRDDWAVHVALTAAGAPGPSAVALPALGRVMSTGEAPGMPTGAGRPLRIAVSRSRAPDIAAAVAARVGAELMPMGSAGYKAMAVVSGEVDAYLHSGGQYEWDSAAPVGVAISAGMHASRIDGSPLVYNRPDPLLPDLLICRPELREMLLGALASELAVTP